MAVRLNRFYNDESLGRGFQNIAGAMAPPSADDQLAGQNALAVRDKARRLSDLFANPNDVNFDRRATAAGLQTGSQSLEAVDLNNATTRSTNAADNARALANNANTTRGSTIASLYGSLSPGQVRPMVPEEVASTIGLPSMAAAQGARKPMTSDEIKAIVLRGLPQNEQRASALQDVPVEQIQTAAGPRIAFRADAVGQAPLPPDVTGKVQNYTGPNGAKGTAVPGPGGKLFDTQTGAEVPAQSTVYSGQATGSPDQFGKVTEAQGRAGYAADMVEGATKDILSAFDTGKLPTRTDTALRSAAETLPSILSPELTTNMSPEGQVFYQNVRTALPMQLLTQSGQGVTEREYERKMAELVPIPGEAPGVTAAKRRQFATYAEAVRKLAGPAGIRDAAAASTTAPSTGAAEGTVIENDAGVRMIRRSGKWEPHNG